MCCWYVKAALIRFSKTDPKNVLCFSLHQGRMSLGLGQSRRGQDMREVGICHLQLGFEGAAEIVLLLKGAYVF